jgi:hypothetical protein
MRLFGFNWILKKNENTQLIDSLEGGMERMAVNYANAS